MNKIKEWWLSLASDTKVIFVLLIVGILCVIWFCGIKGNNQDNFYYKGDKVALVAPKDTTKKDVVIIQFPPKPSKPIRGLNIIKGA